MLLNPIGSPENAYHLTDKHLLGSWRSVGAQTTFSNISITREGGIWYRVSSEIPEEGLLSMYFFVAKVGDTLYMNISHGSIRHGNNNDQYKPFTYEEGKEIGYTVFKYKRISSSQFNLYPLAMLPLKDMVISSKISGALKKTNLCPVSHVLFPNDDSECTIIDLDPEEFTEYLNGHQDELFSESEEVALKYYKIPSITPASN